MHFTGWSHTLEEYVSVLVDAGFVVDALREPVPESKTGRYERWHRYPMFLNLRAIKRGPVGNDTELGHGAPWLNRL
jgi:hypothetical protein